MPDINEHGVGECRHDYRDGKCWYCGQNEKEPNSEALRKIQAMLDDVDEDTPMDQILLANFALAEEVARVRVKRGEEE